MPGGILRDGRSIGINIIDDTSIKGGHMNKLQSFQEFLATQSTQIPFRLTKSSKYIMGIERLNSMKTYSHV